MGFSLGGGVDRRTAIQHPAAVRMLVLVSTPFKHHGWHPENERRDGADGPGGSLASRSAVRVGSAKRPGPRREPDVVLARPSQQTCNQLVRVLSSGRATRQTASD